VIHCDKTHAVTTKVLHLADLTSCVQNLKYLALATPSLF